MAWTGCNATTPCIVQPIVARRTNAAAALMLHACMAAAPDCMKAMQFSIVRSLHPPYALIHSYTDSLGGIHACVPIAPSMHLH
jgi:hypothetical protein